MDRELMLVALRNGALYLANDTETPESAKAVSPETLTAATAYCVGQLVSFGYCPDRKAIEMMNRLTAEELSEVLEVISDVYRIGLNWTPLVKGWDVPTNESVEDHILTLIYNIMADEDLKHALKYKASLLPCGHYIPDGTFDLERYNGCPFCGQPFRTSDHVYLGQASKLKTLTGWDDKDAHRHMIKLMASTVPLSKDQYDDLKILVASYEIDEAKMPDITIREIKIIVADSLLHLVDGATDEDINILQRLIETPTDLLRLLWYEKTGQIKIIKPRTLIHAACKGGRHYNPYQDESVFQELKKKIELKLKYARSECRTVARLLNGMDMSAEKACQYMHPNRGMWVRFIRALRIAEYAKKPGYERLREIMDRFYRTDYEVVQGEIDIATANRDYPRLMQLLKARPGMFMRSLFSLMLQFGPKTVLSDFSQVVDKLPTRLVIELANSADAYFRGVEQGRTVRATSSMMIKIPVNSHLDRYPEPERVSMITSVKNMAYQSLTDRYARMDRISDTIYIAPELKRIPIPVSDRTINKQGAMYVPQGSIFDVQGDKIRLFLHWGKGMKRANIDLDLSAAIVYDDKRTVYCSYFSLSPKGAKHSGDMRQIPDDVGTAEYVELDLAVLRENGARYVAFVANNYSAGSLLTDTMVGWMDSSNPMTVSDKDGVAYDPSCVQQFVIVDNEQLSKGLLFGVLDVPKGQIIYLDMPFDGQSVDRLNIESVKTFMFKLLSKMTIGRALECLAKALDLKQVPKNKITETTLVYDQQWAYNIADVISLLVPQN